MLAIPCAEDIRETQSAIGWTNEKLAERMHKSVSTVEKWRAGSMVMTYADAMLFGAVTRPALRAARLSRV